MKRKRPSGFAGVAMLVAMLISALCPLFHYPGATAEAANLSYTYIPSEDNAWHYIRYKDGDSETSRCTKHKIDGQEAFCVHMRKNNPSGSGSVVTSSLLPGSAPQEAAIVLTWIENGEYEAAGLGLSGNGRYVFKQIAVWRIQDRHGVYDASGWKDAIVDPDDLGISKKTQLSILDALITRATQMKDLYQTTPAAVYRLTKDLNDGDIDYQELGLIGTATRKQGYLEIHKTSAYESITKGNACYDLQGTSYGIYPSRDAAASDSQRIEELILDAGGYAKSGLLDTGTYYVKERKAGTGYLKDETIYEVQVTFNAAPDITNLQVKDQPKVDKKGLSIEKIDKEVGLSGTSLGTATLSGAQFNVNYYDCYADSSNLSNLTPTKSWTFETKEEAKAFLARYSEECKVNGDEVYLMESTPVLPLGTYEIYESKAPKGYLLHDEASLTDVNGKLLAAGSAHYVTQVTASDTDAQMGGGNAYIQKNRVSRGDFKLQKGDTDGQRLAGVIFEITSKTTGESHRFTTDANGTYDSSSAFTKHSVDTNSGKEDTGLWFGEYKGADGSVATVAVNDAYGALVYDDTYVLNEIRCDANKGYALIENVSFKLSRDGYLVDMGTFDDKKISIGTTARDKASGTKEADASKEVVVVDAVAYHGLKANARYTLKATPVLKSSGQALVDATGNPVTATKTFQTTQADGTVEIEVSIPDPKAISGDAVVVFEELYPETDTSVQPIAEEKDVKNEAQTVYVKEATKPLGDTDEPKSEDKPKITRVNSGTVQKITRVRNVETGLDAPNLIALPIGVLLLLIWLLLRETERQNKLRRRRQSVRRAR